ncbi:hypothetical protein VNO77_44599 [Canavalia gladiata]|uniref:Uncharacterized protein n=1 Tax=Canavalia gladiata TaxID=3824 RepID=A0AAN9PQW3_CANGL
MIQVPTYPLHVSELMLVMSAASLETPFKHLAGLYMFRGLCHQHTVQGPDRSIGDLFWTTPIRTSLKSAQLLAPKNLADKMMLGTGSVTVTVLVNTGAESSE